jgi:hypothetical protein
LPIDTLSAQLAAIYGGEAWLEVHREGYRHARGDAAARVERRGEAAMSPCLRTHLVNDSPRKNRRLLQETGRLEIELRVAREQVRGVKERFALRVEVSR